MTSTQKCEYIKQVTNNYDNLIKHKICICIDCFNKYNVDTIINFCDKSTAICPICYVDAILPYTDYNLIHIRKWRNQGFGEKYPNNYTIEMKKEFNIMVKLIIIDIFNNHKNND